MSELQQTEPQGTERQESGRPVGVLATTAAALLGGAGAAWVIGGVFGGGLARLTAIGGAVLGALIAWASYRTSRPALMQLLAVPAALVAGSLLVLPDSGGDLGELPGFVRDAFEQGGLSTPPIAFDPGWRVIVVVLCTVVVVTGVALAVEFAMPRLALAVPLVVIVGGMLVQPSTGETVTAVVALVFVLAGLGVSYGVRLSQEGVGGGRFEVRRLARGAVVVAVLGAGVAGLSQVGFLYPAGDDDDSFPPQRPGTPPPSDAAVVFEVSEPDGTDHIWRTGVLDVYSVDENAWLTPPYDPDRFVPLPESGAVPGDDGPSPDDAEEAVITVVAGGGRELPVSGDVATLSGVSAQYDPRTQTFQSTGRIADGTEYTVASVAVDRDTLAEAPPSTSEELSEFLAAPEIPALVEQLLLTAPPEADGQYERLQFARTALYENVVAAGSGEPVDVSAERAQDIIVQPGTKASPYEITAADALLARWLGVPSRIGYGYYTEGREPNAEGVVEVRPEDGATWLETYHEGIGWVPQPRSPEQAPPPVEAAPEAERPEVTASEDRALLVYVPTRVQTVRLAYEFVGYWVLVIVPWVLALVLAWVWYPAVLKVLRRGKRRRWAAARGLRERIAVAYADLRDVANDFGIGHPTLTPIQFLDTLRPDREHRELAWLTTRALWGDLARDLRIEDAELAEDLARSVRRRLARAQPLPLRVLAGISRQSLRDPYTREIPNLWPRRRRGPLTAIGSALRGLLRRPATLRAAVVVGLAFFTLGGCSSVVIESGPPDPQRAVQPVVPETVAEFALLRSPSAEQAFTGLADQSLVTDGRVYEIYQGSQRQALLQIAWFKSGIEDRDEAKRQMLASIETGEFVFSRIGEERAYVKEAADANVVVWFAPGDTYYQLVVTRKDLPVEALERILKGLLAYQRGDVHEIVNVREAPPQPDPRLGSPG
ncbi:transglutaminase domain-containing protein [Jiangella asiatica]|uniref:Transglutaminase domain-containing protein n=1 Tax=Jiangella asiatica TaxID=2530372 RepID=A0A4R5D8S2_9ACTN|nr:transglutaminaseTgpA domain-containing protein [Jiangella asiatica]TDE09896.1 transglutaminase domain-containing protein [Jiangella asiatica]